jgi:hypothetical protein
MNLDMGGIHHQSFHVSFSQEDEHQFGPDAVVAPTNKSALGVAPAPQSGGRSCQGTQVRSI